MIDLVPPFDERDLCRLSPIAGCRHLRVTNNIAHKSWGQSEIALPSRVNRLHRRSACEQHTDELPVDIDLEVGDFVM